MLYSPMYVAKIELFGAWYLRYVKMLPRAQREIVPSQKHFCGNSWSSAASRDKPINSPFGLCKHCPAIAPVNIIFFCHGWS